MDDNQDKMNVSQDASNDWRESIGRLTSQMVDGALDPNQQQELVTLLESSDDAKRFYLRYLQIHTELSNQWGVAEAPPFANSASLPSDDLDVVSNESDRNFQWPRLLSWLLVGMAASMLFVAVTFGAGLGQWMRSLQRPIAKNIDSSRQDSSTDDASGTSTGSTSPPLTSEHVPINTSRWNDVAVIVGNDGVAGATFKVGKRLKPGVVRFESGTLQLQFMSGAAMVLAGPAELYIESAKSATLLTGTVRTRVNHRAKGFVLNTSQAAVVDIGTEFGLRFDDAGQPEVEVIEGEVEFSLLGVDGSTLMSRRVQESEVVAVDSQAGTPNRLSAKDKRADNGPQILLPVVTAPGSSANYSQLIIEERPLVYWRFESEADGVIPNEMGPKWPAQIVHQPKAEQVITIDEGTLRMSRSRAPRYVASSEPIEGLDNGPFSVEFWMNPDDLEHSQCVGLTPHLAKDPMAFLGVVEIVTDTFLIHQPGSLRILYRNPPDRRQEFGKNLFSPGMLTPGQWHHVVMVKSENFLEMYLNGKSIRVVDAEIGFEVGLEEGYRIILGQLSMVFSMRQFSGALDEFALYDRALDGSQILEHYQAAASSR